MKARDGGYPEQEPVRIALQSHIRVAGALQRVATELGVDPRSVRRWLASQEHIPERVCNQLGFKLKKEFAGWESKTIQVQVFKQRYIRQMS